VYPQGSISVYSDFLLFFYAFLILALRRERAPVFWMLAHFEVKNKLFVATPAGSRIDAHLCPLQLITWFTVRASKHCQLAEITGIVQ
jgi:hypothetical protein